MPSGGIHVRPHTSWRRSQKRLTGCFAESPSGPSRTRSWRRPSDARPAAGFPSPSTTGSSPSGSKSSPSCISRGIQEPGSGESDASGRHRAVARNPPRRRHAIARCAPSCCPFVLPCSLSTNARWTCRNLPFPCAPLLSSQRQFVRSLAPRGKLAGVRPRGTVPPRNGRTPESPSWRKQGLTAPN